MYEGRNLPSRLPKVNSRLSSLREYGDVKGWPTVEQQLGPQDCLSKAEEREKNWWTCPNTIPFVWGWRGGAGAPRWSVRVGPMGRHGRGRTRTGIAGAIIRGLNRDR